MLTDMHLRKAIKKGKDSGVERKQAAAAVLIAADNIFEANGRARHKLNKPRWGKVHAKDVIDSLEEDISPRLAVWRSRT